MGMRTRVHSGDVLVLFCDGALALFPAHIDSRVSCRIASDMGMTHARAVEFRRVGKVGAVPRDHEPSLGQGPSGSSSPTRAGAGPTRQAAGQPALLGGGGGGVTVHLSIVTKLRWEATHITIRHSFPYRKRTGTA